MSLPKKPWRIVDSLNERKGTGYIHIQGPNGEKICDIFPYAGVGGLGLEAARAVAEMIVSARENLP